MSADRHRTLVTSAETATATPMIRANPTLFAKDARMIFDYRNKVENILVIDFVDLLGTPGGMQHEETVGHYPVSQVNKPGRLQKVTSHEECRG